MDAFETIREAIGRLNYAKAPLGLYEPIAYALSTGGKRLRPALALIAGDLFDGSPEEVLPAALALELFHNFTLLHDDVMDNASIRRGKPCVHIRWNVNTAILSGDEMLIEAYGMLQQVPERKLREVMRLFTKMATEICEGQQYDVDFEAQPDVTLADYMEMIRLKTAVLLATALQMGGYIAGAGTKEQKALYNYGINIGLAFQLQDDLLDVYGDPLTFGKATGGDILEGKKTFLLLTALQKATAEENAELLRWKNLNPVSEEEKKQKIAAVTDIYNRLGVKQDCEEAIRRYTLLALTELDKIEVAEEKKLTLKNLAERLLARKE